MTSAENVSKDANSITRFMFDVGDARLHVELSGDHGPIVVVETGDGGMVDAWRPMRLHLPDTRVLLYDRPGFGNSTKTAAAVDACAAADRLARLLVGQMLTEPVVLVAHSAGAFRAICFADRHPELLGALVLIDPSVPDTPALLRALRILRFVTRVPGMFGSFVVARLKVRGSHRTTAPAMSTSRPSGQTLGYLRAVLDEAMSAGVSRRQARTASMPPSLPLIVVTRAEPSRQCQSPHEWIALHLWTGVHERQHRLASRSVNSVHIVAKHAGHSVHRDEPETVAAAIHLAISALTAGDQSRDDHLLPIMGLQPQVATSSTILSPIPISSIETAPVQPPTEEALS